VSSLKRKRALARAKAKARRLLASPRLKPVELVASPMCGTTDFDQFFKSKLKRALSYQTTARILK